MKLQVRPYTDNGGIRRYVLCDERGVMLPMQERTVIESKIDDLTKITVTFVVAGDVEFVDEPMEESNAD